MSGLSVGEALREADSQMRALSFEATDSFHAQALIVGWAPFLTAARDVARNLPGPSELRHDLARLVTRWRWHAPTHLEPHPRLAVATEALTRVAAMTGGRELRGAPDLAQVTGHLASIVCIGAHATTASIGQYLAETLPVAQNRPGHVSTIEASSLIPRPVFARLHPRVAFAEELTLIALAQAGRHTPPVAAALPATQVQHAATGWAQAAEQALTRGTVSIGDLKTIARVNEQLALHTAHLARAGLEVGALTSAQHQQLRPALETAARAWAAAERDWHPSMTATPGAGPTRELARAGMNLSQAWRSITNPTQRWATGAEIAAEHDLGELLHYAAQAHRRLALIARDYTSAAERLLDSETITVPTQLAARYTGQPSPQRRVPLTAQYAQRASFGHGRLTSAAQSARIALDTTVTHSPAATAARARLPIAMAADELDAAIRARIDTLTQQRAHRATKPPHPRPNPPENPQPGPRLR